MATRVQEQLGKQLKELERARTIKKAFGGRSAIIITKNLDEAIALANRYAPEHLVLAVDTPDTCIKQVTNAGAIFHVDNMKGVFQGVITPTGPIGTRVVTFIKVGEGRCCPSRADVAWSAKKRKFSAPRNAALDMKRSAWPVSQHSASAISSARATIPSAILCRIFLRATASMSRQAGKAALAAAAAASISAAVPRAT